MNERKKKLKSLVKTSGKTEVIVLIANFFSLYLLYFQGVIYTKNVYLPVKLVFFMLHETLKCLPAIVVGGA